MQKITFEINGWKYNISVEDTFARYLQSEISNDFALRSPDSRKTIVSAYVKAKYQLFEQEQEINKIIEGLS